MESQDLSLLSSLRGELKQEDYIQPHYKETYRLAIDHLLSGGRESYREFIKEERIGSFLSEEEQLFISANVQKPPEAAAAEDDVHHVPSDSPSSTGTYWPMHSDVATPDLELGWPAVKHERLQTSVDMLYHPPRQNSPPIKEVIRKHIQEARQVIAIVMDMFTDIDIFKETVDAAGRGVPVYVLLDDLNLKSFLAMAENQDVKIQQLRNMRVRTVRGHEYLCRSGAKFHGAMKQNFLLVDCKTAIYGSYSDVLRHSMTRLYDKSLTVHFMSVHSFTWSFEKIHLSMVQVITGHLVQSYDEEFRMLYARSTVPEELCPLPGAPKDVANGRPTITNSTNVFQRKNHLRHTLDAVYLKSCERQVGMKLPEQRIYEEPTEHMANHLKRHSYAAGERQDGPHIPQHVRHGASNWNISGDTWSPHDRNNYPMMDKYSQAPQMGRGQNVHQSYNGNDKQQVPTLENTSKSFMRTWRIESYLKNPDNSFSNSWDTLDQYESPDTKPSSSLQSRMRSSLVFNTTIPEHLEGHSY
ncbi:hypothetical protein CRUP_016469, partial [Coryphaenoides rupestris]